MIDLTITQAIQKLRNREISSLELTTAYLNRIKNIDEKINAFNTITSDTAIKSAKAADELLALGDNKLPLLGIPLSIKDNFSTKGIRTTGSSKVLDSYIPPYDATVIEKLKDAGMVLIGKVNMDAWAHGSSTETSDYGPTRNPWNTDYLPGGSSGGSAASVIADECCASVGSETAGSIRQPSSWCGVVGLKPTYGRVSRYGVIAMGSSLDSPGPITKNVEDAAYILQILAGKDPKDATTSPRNVPNYLSALKGDISDLTIGVAEDYFEGVDTEIQQLVKDALKILEKKGAKIKKINLFAPKYAIAVYTILQRAEVSSNLARYDGIRYGNERSYFGEEAKRRIMFGTYTLSAGYYDHYYNSASKVRTLIIEDFAKSFKSVDVIIGPTSPSTALPIGASLDHPMFGEMADILVEPSSIAGLPGINVPCGFTKNKLPVGLQIIGPQFCEELILKTAYKFEQEAEFFKQRPNL